MANPLKPVIPKATVELAESVGIAPACEALAVPRSTFYRSSNPRPTVGSVRPGSHRRLSEAERQEVLKVLHSDRFADKSPAQVYAILLDEGIYYCSIRTMYRILEAHGEVRERRNQLL